MPGADREFEKDRKLFVGGLDYETTDSVLKEYFEQFLEEENINLTDSDWTNQCVHNFATTTQFE